MSLGSFLESLTETPTVTPENEASLPGLTPGGLDPADNVPTLGRMQAGSFVAKLVCAIEGCKYLLSDAPSAAVLSAWANASGGDWTEVLGGLFVELANNQSIRPDDPFPNSGRCVVKVLDEDRSDTFGKFVNKRASGQSTAITETIDRDATTINVASTTGFASSGIAYLGAEAFAYTGTTATSFTGCTRGKYSPFACDSSGAGGSRFATHQRTARDIYHTQQNPRVSEVPRVWIGRKVGIWLHTWNEETQQLNTQKNAQLVFAGRIVGISDDAGEMVTSLEIEHESATFKNAVIFKDPWAATVADGIYIPVGRTFKFTDIKDGSAAGVADDLVAVAGAPADSNEIESGYYNADELCQVLNRWLAGELNAGRIYGHYSWASPVSSSVGLRTKCYWRIEHASSVACSFDIQMPGEIAAFLGLRDATPGELGVSALWYDRPGTYTNTDHTAQGDAVPYASLVFKPSGPGRLAQEFTEAINYEAENERGVFIGQRDFMPASVKESCSADYEWGFFLLDDKTLMVGSYDDGVLTNCWLAPFQRTSDTDTEAVSYIGRRLDEQEGGPITLRQVMIIESVYSTLLNMLMYSTGTAGYNHSEYDVFAYGLGVGMPGEMLGDRFEQSITNQPGANAPMVVMLDEPTKFADLLRDDFRLRRTFLRWKDEHFEFQAWRTPLVANAVATLEEENKAAPVGTEDNHRIASQETDEWYFPVVKVDYARDMASSRNGQYLKSIQLEDQTATDEASGSGRSLTLKMRNTYGMFQSTGAAIEELIKDYLPGMPMFSRPARVIVRSIDLRYFETLAPGDIVIITDNFARDPLTGARGIVGRAALITRLSYNLGGPTTTGAVRSMVGEVELFFLDVQRGGEYCPCADIDWEWNLGGFSAGYLAATKTIMCKPHVYTRRAGVVSRRGLATDAEPLDASFFEVGDKVTVVERDPSDTASPTTWNDTVASVNGNAIGLTTGLAGWSSFGKFRVIYQQYTSVTATQADKAFQADDTDEMVQDVEIAYEFSVDEEPYGYRDNTLTDKAELIPALAYGDGKPMDVGIDRILAINANHILDYKTAHQSVTISGNQQSANLGPGGPTDDWQILFMTPIFLGQEHLTSSVTRTLTVAPQWRSAMGGDSWLRITLSRQLPIAGPGALNFLAGWLNPTYSGEFSQVQYGPITNTTYEIGADATLSLGVKNLTLGYAWLIVEGAGDAQCKNGVIKCLEGPRSS